MSRLFARKTLLGLGILATLVLIVTVNIIGGNLLRGVRLDLTETKLYTLSPATDRALKQIEEPITLRLFISDRLTREVPSFAAYAQRVRDLLRDYAAGSRGRLTVEVLSPDPFSPSKTAPLPMVCRACPSTRAASRFTSASSALTPPTIRK